MMTRPMGIPALILGGGLSRRMGEDKTCASLGGVPLIEVIAGRLRPQVSTLAVNLPADHPLAGEYLNIPDTVPDRPGPLAGILAGLRAFSGEADYLMTVPGDAPFLPSDLMARLAATMNPQEIVMAGSSGREHPVVALWPTGIADDLEAWIANPENRRVRGYIHRHPFRVVTFAMRRRADGLGAIDPFFNINTPADLAFARDVIAGGGV